MDGYVALPHNETAMAAALVALGPLSVLMDASGLQFYRRGVWDPALCSKTDTDHAVQLVRAPAHHSSCTAPWLSLAPCRHRHRPG